MPDQPTDRRPPPPRPTLDASSRPVPSAPAVAAVPATPPPSASVPASEPVQAVDFASSTGTPPPAKIDPYVGKVIDGRYVIDSVLGEGGMGIVYRGRHKVIDKKIAIKVLRGDMAKDAEVTERFLQEARAASAIGNPHIIDISDFGTLPDGSTYFIMEYLDGKSLGDILIEKVGPVPVTRLCHIAKQIAQALAAAHTANIIHRDLKPDNVMLIARGNEKDFVKILDFGIAKVGGAGSKMTRAGSVFGTPHYMSPEQAAGAVVDLRTDIYALGVILYEMASGKVPFDADNFMGILTQHMYKSPVPIRALVPQVDVPPGLDAIILKCLTKKPEGRYAGMDALVLDLEKLERGVLPDAVQEMMARSGGFNVPADYFRSSAMPAPVPASPLGIPKRSRWPLYAAIAAVASAVALVAVVLVAKSGNGTAQATSASNAAGSAQAAASKPTSTTTSAAPVKEAVVAATPANAIITRDGKAFRNPALLDLPDGTSTDVIVSAEGYQSQTVTLKAGDSKNVVLVKEKPVAALPAAGKGPAVRPPPATTTTATAAPPSKPPGKRCDPDDPFCSH
jgi:serine/threonine protein kinase